MARNNTDIPTVRSAFGIVGFSILLSLVVGAVIIIVFSSGDIESTSPLVTAMALFAGQGLMALPVIIYFLIRKTPVLKSVQLKNVPFRLLIHTFIFGLGLLVVYDEIDRLISKILTPPDSLFDLSPFLSMDAPFTALVIILTIVIFAPVGEEIVFRGFLQRSLELNWKDSTKAVLVTSMFFALIHMNPYWLIQIYLWGVILGYLAYQTGSIVPSILLHGLNNGASIFLNSSGLNIEKYYEWNGHVSPIFILIGLVFLFFGFQQIQSFRKSTS